MKSSQRFFCLIVLSLFFITACDGVEPTTTIQTGEVDLTSGIYGGNQTPTGFYWPTGKEVSNGNWLSDSCNGKSNYLVDDAYHIGTDIEAEVPDSVYAIADGRIVNVSLNGWGKDNIGLVIEHRTSDGNSFIAVYGHIQSTLVKIENGIGSPLPEKENVIAGQEIGTIGHWDYGDHLHFGIRPSTSLVAPYGFMECKNYPDTNGFEDPIQWITTMSPMQLENAGVVSSAFAQKESNILPTLSFIGENTDGTKSFYIINALGENLQELFDFDTEGLGNYRWAPNGKTIAWAKSNYYVVSEEKWDILQITNFNNGSTTLSPPMWIDDQLFTGIISGETQSIVTFNSSTGIEDNRLQTEIGTFGMPLIASRNYSYAITTMGANQGFVFVINLSNGLATSISDGIGNPLNGDFTDDDSIGWTADDRIIIRSFGRKPGTQLFTVNLDGGDLQQLTNNPSTSRMGYDVSVSGDGSLVSYALCDESSINCDLMMVNTIEESREEKLFETSGIIMNIVWSPNDDLIGYIYSDDYSSARQICIYNLFHKSISCFYPSPSINNFYDLQWRP